MNILLIWLKNLLSLIIKPYVTNHNETWIKRKLLIRFKVPVWHAITLHDRLVSLCCMSKKGRHFNVIKYIVPLKVETQNLFWAVISNLLLFNSLLKVQICSIINSLCIIYEMPFADMSIYKLDRKWTTWKDYDFRPLVFYYFIFVTYWNIENKIAYNISFAMSLRNIICWWFR